MSTEPFHTQGFFELEGPAEPSFLSRVLQVLQLRGCVVERFACDRQGDRFALSVVIAEADRCRPDHIALLFGRIVGLGRLRWYVEGRRSDAIRRLA